MPLYRDKTTNIVTELPVNVGTHRVLGRNLEPYTPDLEIFEEDKVVDETAVSTQRLHTTATRITEPASEVLGAKSAITPTTSKDKS